MLSLRGFDSGLLCDSLSILLRFLLDLCAVITAPLLPSSHAVFLERWLALETSLSFFRRRGEPALYGRLKKAVEATGGKAFHPRHLGQMLALWPGCYTVRRQRVVADAASYARGVGGGGGGGARGTGGEDNDGGGSSGNGGYRFDWSIELGVVDEDGTSTRAGGKRRSPTMTEAVLVARRKCIADAVGAHAAASSGSSASASSSVQAAAAASGGAADDAASLAADLFVAADIDVEPVALPPLTAASAPGPPPASAAAAVHLPGDGASPPAMASSSSSSSSSSSQAPPPPPGAAAKLAALRSRVAARERADADAEAAAGGAAGRRARRLAGALPGFVDALHSFLVQRRAGVLEQATLVGQLGARLPHPQPPAADVAELLEMVLALCPDWCRAVRVERTKADGVTCAVDGSAATAVELLQFNGSIQFSTVRRRAANAARRGALLDTTTAAAAAAPQDLKTAAPAVEVAMSGTPP